MATIDSPSIILTILENNGVYPGDPQLAQVYSYISGYPPHNKVYAIYLHPQRLTESMYVIEPTLLFDKDLGLTKEGRDEVFRLRNNKDSL